MKYIEFMDWVNKEKHIIPADKIVVTETKVHSITNNMIWLISKDEYVKIKNQLIQRNEFVQPKKFKKPFIPFVLGDYVTHRIEPTDKNDFDLYKVVSQKPEIFDACVIRNVKTGKILYNQLVKDLTKVEQRKKEKY